MKKKLYEEGKREIQKERTYKKRRFCKEKKRYIEKELI